jgi:hypothetical protein
MIYIPPPDDSHLLVETKKRNILNTEKSKYVNVVFDTITLANIRVL